MATKQKKGSAQTKPTTEKGVKAPTQEDVSKFFSDEGGVVSGRIGDDTEAFDEDEQKEANEKVIEVNKEKMDEMAEELAEMDENTVVYRSKYKGHYLSLDAGHEEEYMNAGVMRKRQAKIRCQFKMNLFTTDKPEVIETLDKYIAKFTRKKMKAPIMRLDAWKKTQTTSVSKEDVLKDISYTELEQIYLKRKRELKGIQEIKRGTITT